MNARVRTNPMLGRRLGGLLESCAMPKLVPLLPSAFEARLNTKSFANPEKDRALVAKLYEQAFTKHFATLTYVDFLGLRYARAQRRRLHAPTLALFAPHI